jgi:glycerol kinase
VIWQTQLATAREALAKAGLAATDIHAVGITNQRETTVVWNRKTGQPVHHAIVWQDRRAEPTCAQLRADGKAMPSGQKPGCWSTPTSPAPSCSGLLTTCPAPVRR